MAVVHCDWCCREFTQVNASVFCSKPCVWGFQYGRAIRRLRSMGEEGKTLLDSEKIEGLVSGDQCVVLPDIQG